MNTTAVERTRAEAVRARLYSSRGGQLFASVLRPRALVLVYHRVAEPIRDPAGQAVTPRNFAAHLSLLRRHYDVSDAATLVGELQGRRLRHGSVTVTFDDGYADVLHAAVPAAAAEGVPLHLFVSVGPVVSGQPFWWDRLAAAIEPNARGYEDWHARLRRLPQEAREAELERILEGQPAGDVGDLGRPMTPDELKTFAITKGMSVGAHTFSHPSLAALVEAEQRRELALSREALEQLTGGQVDLVAYPFGKEGDVSATTRALAAATGYVAAFTSVALPVVRRSDSYAIPRLAVHDWNQDEFARRLQAIFGF